MSNDLTIRDEDLVLEEQCAAVLVGLPVAELRQLARINGLGRFCPYVEGSESAGRETPLLLTYTELATLGFLAARSQD